MQRISVFAAIAAAFGVFVSGPGLAQTADGLTPAEETICDVLDGVGAAWGLCNAYCEAMDCDGDPRASQKACNKVLQRFESVSDQPLPCGQKTVFITSGLFTGDLAFEGGGADGLAGADFLCQSEADDPSSIAPAGTYKAWLADGNDGAGDSPDTTFNRSLFPYSLVDGTQIANNYVDLTDGDILHAIDLDASGMSPPSILSVWTGTNTDGTSNNIFFNCDGWTNGVSGRGTIGNAVDGISPVGRWSTDGVSSCSNDKRLYCFQQ